MTDKEVPHEKKGFFQKLKEEIILMWEFWKDLDIINAFLDKRLYLRLWSEDHYYHYDRKITVDDKTATVKLPPRPQNRRTRKWTLVLDGKLLYPESFEKRGFDHPYTYYWTIVKRPHVDIFLQTLALNYEICIMDFSTGKAKFDPWKNVVDFWAMGAKLVNIF